MPVRMTDIARDLGLSIITVSKALRNCPDISAKTRARVLRLCQELHYRPNLATRCLVTGRTNMMGLVIPDLAHTFFTELVRGMSGATYRTTVIFLAPTRSKSALRPSRLTSFAREMTWH